MHTTPQTWNAARAACEEACGHLATISDAAENAEVLRIWQAADADRREVWIGLSEGHSNAEGRTWKWVSGGSTAYTGWDDGEPNNHRGVEEKRVAMWPSGGLCPELNQGILRLHVVPRQVLVCRVKFCWVSGYTSRRGLS